VENAERTNNSLDKIKVLYENYVYFMSMWSEDRVTKWTFRYFSLAIQRLIPLTNVVKFFTRPIRNLHVYNSLVNYRFSISKIHKA
jgi:hypothetical protein